MARDLAIPNERQLIDQAGTIRDLAILSDPHRIAKLERFWRERRDQDSSSLDGACVDSARM
jgi:hypothetical protein